MKKAAVIMAGGRGTRFWPRSTEKTPKQLIHLIGEGTMLQNTYSRIRKLFEPEDIYIIGTKSINDEITRQLGELPSENIISEPFARNTAPCMGLAELLLHEKYDDDAILAAFPADHYIENVGEFSQSIEFAMRAAEETEGIVTIGIEPTRPETQYGYVQIKDEPGDLGELYDYGVRYTQTFAEKPDRGTALRFIESGDFLWNSGIFVLSLGAVRHAMEKYLPEHALQFRSIKKHIGRETFEENLDYIYRQMNSISFDYAIMEKAGNVFVVESSFQWSDLGTWDELYRLSMKDARNNVIEGDVISINTSNSFVSSQGKIIGVIGLDDVIVVDSDEALLICKRGDADSISDLLDYLKRKNINKYL